jgi:epoxyqueuosine reductase QueG
MLDYNERILALVTQRRLAEEKLSKFQKIVSVGVTLPPAEDRDLEEAMRIELKREINRYQQSIDAYIYGHGVAE